jgi:alpha-glucosidase (family GH31 glycosyl hydrolase)
MVSNLQQRGVRMLSYINPFFSDVEDPYAPQAEASSVSAVDVDGRDGEQGEHTHGASDRTHSTVSTNSTHTVYTHTHTHTPPTPTSPTPTPMRNLYKEGVEHGYFVQSPIPGVGTYRFRSGSIDFAMLDTTNPTARVWMKGVIKYMVGDTGVSGWMADFGEYLPFDAGKRGVCMYV